MGNPNLEKAILAKYENVKKNIANKVAPEINKLFRESVRESVNNYYQSYSPRYYQRTDNFKNVIESSRTSGRGDVLEMMVSSGYMNNYSGNNKFGNTYSISGQPQKYNGQKLNASIAFDFFFNKGEHGHGKLLAATSTPPYELVSNDIKTGFDGKVQKIVRDAFKKH